MPSKPQSKVTTQTGEVNFVLKHRIVGAGFLLFFSALVLPWLLGPPSEAFKLSEGPLTDSSQISVAIEKTGQQAVEQKNLIPEQEQVYISKITPLDRGANNSTNDTTKNLATADKSNGKENSSDGQTAQQKAENKTGSSDKLKEDSTKSAEGSSKLSEGSMKPVVAANKSTSKDSSSTETAANTPRLLSTKAESPISAAAKIDVGWIVQVGVFTDKRGAAKVVDDLRSKDFNPSTSIVDTNRGKATGTRIWLGPYAQRVEAAKAKSLLTSKTGEAGFIRAYP